MKTWWRKFWYEHGERILYLAGAGLVSICLFSVGRTYEIPEFVDTSKIIATGIAMLLFNKARGRSITHEEEEKPNA